MNEYEELQTLIQENQQLKADNEMLLDIIAQMRTTLNRLINHYMAGDHSKDIA